MPMDAASSSNAATDNGDLNGAVEATHQDRSRCCFQEWMQLQRQDLTHLLQSLGGQYSRSNAEQIETLIDSCIAHFEEYISTRSRLAQEEASPFFAPTWCTSLENSLLWIAGCRPSIFIRLLYALSGHEVDARLGEWLEGVRSGGVLGDLSPSQMARVDALHMRTIREEERLSGEMASCQEELADQPIAVIANQMEMEAGMVANEEAEAALREHESLMRGVMKAADELRLTTLEEVIHILNPVQAVEFLVAGKKLHLSLHQWGKHRDERHGRTCNY